MEHNRSPMSTRDGKGFIDGIEVMDGVAMTITFTPEVWTGRQLGDKTPSTRWLGYSITGSITRRRNNRFLREVVMKYRREGKTPELTITGIMADECSDYHQQFGNDAITAVGCVPTGDITLIKLDANGDILDDVIAFNAMDVT